MTLDEEGTAARHLDEMFEDVKGGRRELIMRQFSKYHIKDVLAAIDRHALSHDRLVIPDLVSELERGRWRRSEQAPAAIAEQKALKAMEEAQLREDREYERYRAELTDEEIAALRDQSITENNLSRRIYGGKDPAHSRMLKRYILQILRKRKQR